MLATALLTLAIQTPEPVAGIAAELAHARAAAIANVHYGLRVTLTAAADRATGSLTLDFELTAAWQGDAPLVLDFGGDAFTQMVVNDEPLQPAALADHLLIPARTLHRGQNRIDCSFASSIAAAGTPISVYREPDGKGVYCYTLLVPADAHRLFPCFDQPDLKATFALELDLPTAWTAVANGRELGVEPRDDHRHWSFATTERLPTYLFAFACGTFAVETVDLSAVPGLANDAQMRIFVRPSQRGAADVPALQRLHAEGLRWLGNFFGVDYPFGKLDIALVPGFSYGGMEHAGAIFYRETALAFDHPPTDGELVRRSTLVYHELSHQWFGNLVTMKWFDDLWLKEGFATFAAYRALEELEPERHSWLRFLQRVKPRAYEVDTTPGTTPVYQSLQNLADAKSAYGPIVYNKAPAVLRELEQRIGGDAFRAGLHAFLAAHRFGNATWRELAQCLERAAKADLGRWSQRWLLAKSLPQVRVRWSVGADGAIGDAVLEQRDIDGSGTWPLHVELLIGDRDGKWNRIAVDSDATAQDIPALHGRRDVTCIVANPGDVAYAQFLPDEQSRDWIAAHVHEVEDPLLRAVMIATLFESVREAESPPAVFAAAALHLLAQERDADTHAWLLDQFGTCLERYCGGDTARSLRQQAEELLLDQLSAAGEDRRKLTIFRFLMRHGTDDRVAGLRRAAVRGEGLPAGLALGREDRFLALAAVLAAPGVADDDSPAQVERDLVAAFAGTDVGRDLFLAKAAMASAKCKADYFAAYRDSAATPEQWAQDSLPFFHWRGQSDLTRPYLRPALELAQWVKANRRIFFMPAWLDAFVNGHSDAGALQIVDDFLASAAIDADVRQKLLQARDGLARAVRIRARYPDGR